MHSSVSKVEVMTCLVREGVEFKDSPNSSFRYRARSLAPVYAVDCKRPLIGICEVFEQSPACQFNLRICTTALFTVAFLGTLVKWKGAEVDAL